MCKHFVNKTNITFEWHTRTTLFIFSWNELLSSYIILCAECSESVTMLCICYLYGCSALLSLFQCIFLFTCSIVVVVFELFCLTVCSIHCFAIFVFCCLNIFSNIQSGVASHIFKNSHINGTRTINGMCAVICRTKCIRLVWHNTLSHFIRVSFA